jgi:hypothetical protein
MERKKVIWLDIPECIRNERKRGYDPYNSAEARDRYHGDTLDFEATSEYDANRKLADSIASQQFERK